MGSNDQPKRLWVDDERQPPTDQHWMWAKTSEEAILTLQAVPVTEMSLDYTLANKPNGDWDDGAAVMRWLRDGHLDRKPPVIIAHSGSASGRLLIEKIRDDLDKMVTETGAHR